MVIVKRFPVVGFIPFLIFVPYIDYGRNPIFLDGDIKGVAILIAGKARRAKNNPRPAFFTQHGKIAEIPYIVPLVDVFKKRLDVVYFFLGVATAQFYRIVEKIKKQSLLFVRFRESQRAS